MKEQCREKFVRKVEDYLIHDLNTYIKTYSIPVLPRLNCFYAKPEREQLRAKYHIPFAIIEKWKDDNFYWELKTMKRIVEILTTERKMPKAWEGLNSHQIVGRGNKYV